MYSSYETVYTRQFSETVNILKSVQKVSEEDSRTRTFFSLQVPLPFKEQSLLKELVSSENSISLHPNSSNPLSQTGYNKNKDEVAPNTKSKSNWKGIFFRKVQESEKHQ